MAKIEVKHILIVEDDVEASYLMQNFLINCGYTVNCVETIADGISHIKNGNYNLILLDIQLPDSTGLDLLNTIKNFINIPILVISAYSDTQTKIEAFSSGAIDYLTKPIDFLELEARILAQFMRIDTINRLNLKKEPTFQISNNQIRFQEEPLSLTTTEFNIFNVLITNKNMIVSRDDFVELIPSIKSHRLLDNHIKNIRMKIEINIKLPQYLLTIYGQGYKLVF